MRRATWGRCVSGRCCGVRESSSQPLTPKGTAPLLHCPDPRKARATFHGACPRRTRMAMPVAPYIDVGGTERLRRVTGRAGSVTPCARPGTAAPPEGSPLRHRSPARRSAPGSHAASNPARPPRPDPLPGRRADTDPPVGIRLLPRAPRHSVRFGRPTCPGGAKKRPHIGVVRRSNDRITYAQPSIFSQLHTPVASLPNWPINPLATRQEETARYASTRRGRAIKARRTSLHGRRVKPFVIECFPPSCLVDITPVGELVTPGPRDAVDSILGRRGSHAGPRGNVQERQARKDQGDVNTEGA